MDRSLTYWLTAAYRANTPEMAQDDSPARGLLSRMRSLGVRWQQKFDEAAESLARYFGTAAIDRADGALAGILSDAGISVRFKMTAAANDVMQATIGEQIGLIRSIASEHLADVNGMLMRSVQRGGDLAGMTTELRARYDITKRRAATIARDQNNKATASITRVRQQELGITQAKWLHSGGGRHPRQEHVEFANGKRGGPFYDVNKGAFLEGEWVWPGQAVNCRCVARAVIEGFS